MYKKAFTMFELVLAIVVLGILSSLVIPRLNRDLKQDAADMVLSFIRYTQHLALLDDLHSRNDPKWQQRFWRIYFGECEGKRFFAIGSDDSEDSDPDGRVDFMESTLDPSSGKRMWAKDGNNCSGDHSMSDLSPSIFISEKYGITSVSFSGGCDNDYIGFDHLGRPYSDKFPQSSKPDNDGYMTSSCTLSFTLSDDSSFAINIEPETGYAHIIGQPDS